MKEKLLKNGNKRHELTAEERVRGGQAISPRKRMSSVLNSLLSNSNCTPERAYLLTCLRDGQFEKLLKELLALDLENVDDVRARERVYAVLLKMLPQRNLNLNVDAGSGVVNVQQYEKFRDAVFEIVTPEQRELILERSRSAGVPETTRDVLKNIFAELKEEKDDELE